MLLATEYSVTLDHEASPNVTEEYTEIKGIHEGANGENHDVTLRFLNGSDDIQFCEDLKAEAIENDNVDMMLISVTGPACPEITATQLTIPERTINKGKDNEETLPETDKQCGQVKNLIVEVQTLRQRNPKEPISSSVVAVGEGLINTYVPKDNKGKVPRNYKVCDEIHLCIPASSELNESVDPMKVKPAEGLPVSRFFQPAQTMDEPSSFPSGYVCVTGFLEFTEGGFYGNDGNAVAYSRLRIVATDVLPLGIAPNGRSESKRQQQMLQQKKRVIKFSDDASEDSAPTQKRSLASLRK